MATATAMGMVTVEAIPSAGMLYSTSISREPIPNTTAQPSSVSMTHLSYVMRVERTCVCQ